MDIAGPISNSIQTRKLLLGTSFALGIVVITTLAGIATGIRQIRRRSSTRNQVFIITGHLLLVLGASTIAFARLLLFEDVWLRVCSVQGIVETALDQLGRVSLLYLFVKRIASSFTSWRKRVGLFALVLIRFGLGTLFSVTTKVFSNIYCRPVHIPAFRLLLTIVDCVFDLLLVLMAARFAVGSVSTRHNVGTMALVILGFPLHLSALSEFSSIDMSLRHSIVRSTLETLLNIALVSIISFEDADNTSITEITCGGSKHAGFGSVKPTAKNRPAILPVAGYSITTPPLDDFEHPRSAPTKPKASALTRKIVPTVRSRSVGETSSETQRIDRTREYQQWHSDLVKETGLDPSTTTAWQSRPRDDEGTPAGAKEVSLSSGSTLQHIRKASAAGAELLVFDLEGGMITPITTAVPRTFSVSSSTYSDVLEYVLVSDTGTRNVGAPHDQRSVQRQHLPDYMQFEALARPSNRDLARTGDWTVTLGSVNWNEVDYSSRYEDYRPRAASNARNIVDDHVNETGRLAHHTIPPWANLDRND